MEKLNQLDTTNVEPLAHCLPINNCFRDDELKHRLERKKRLPMHRKRMSNSFKVPKILEEPGGF